VVADFLKETELHFGFGLQAATIQGNESHKPLA
jgi:hypothetical protein